MIIETTTKKHSSNLQTETQITSGVAPWLIKLVYPFAKYFLMPFFFRKIVVTGQENIPSEGAVIVAPTHRSRWDALIVPYATGRLVSNRDPHFMVSANEISGIQGWFITRLGGFPIDTHHPAFSSLKHSFDLLCQGEMVVIFPEGNIFRTETVQPLKRGVAKIALEVAIARSAPLSVIAKPENTINILPVSVKYSEKIPQRGCSVEVKIGKCLNINEYPADSSRENSMRLTKDLENALKAIHEQ